MARKLTAGQRSQIASKLMDLGNLIFAALVVGQVLTDGIDLLAAVGGVIVFMGMYYLAIKVMKRR